jgi:hypothetical protein
MSKQDTCGLDTDGRDSLGPDNKNEKSYTPVVCFYSTFIITAIGRQEMMFKNPRLFFVIRKNREREREIINHIRSISFHSSQWSWMWMFFMLHDMTCIVYRKVETCQWTDRKREILKKSWGTKIVIDRQGDHIYYTSISVIEKLIIK